MNRVMMAGRWLVLLLASIVLAMPVCAEDRPVSEAASLLASDGGYLAIGEIQGAGHTSALNRERVDGVAGIVTAIIPNRGFYLQSPVADDDPATSEGIYVHTRKVREVSVGDLLVLDDVKVEEYYPGAGQLSVTRLKLPDITVIESGFALPEPVILGEGGRIPPSEVISNDAHGDTEESLFDPEEDGIDFYESLEAMLVRINEPRAVGTIHTLYGEIHVVADDGRHAGVESPRGGLVLRPDDFNPERIMIDLIENPNIASQPAGFSMVVGDRFAGSITGVVDYAFGSYKVLPIHTVPEVIEAGLPRERTTIDPDSLPRALSVGACNVLNLAGDDPEAKFTDIAETIVAGLAAPDLVVLSEIQDDTGATNDGTVSADATAARLIEAIANVGGPRYEYLDIPPKNNADGGEPGGNIRVGFLYDPQRLSPAAGERDDDPNRAVSVDSRAGITLTPNPGRIGADDYAFAASRKPLAAHFDFYGRGVFVIGAHLNSKSGDGDLFGRTQPPVLGSEEKRVRQAEAVASLVSDLLDLDPGAAIIVAGDLNDFWFSRPLEVLESAGLINLVPELLAEGERYTYVYEGNSQTLDHVLVSPALFVTGRTEVDIVHRYAEYLYGVRKSDHDPIHALLEWEQ